MKKILSILIITTFPLLILNAQAPQAFRYQAIARDANGNILSNWPINIRISIVQGGEDSKTVYIETHKVTSNIYGLINLTIGEGELCTGEFKKISWSENRHYIKLEMDIKGDENYKTMGTNPLYAVPYALFAEEAGRLRDLAIGPEQSTPDHKTKKPTTKSKPGGNTRSNGTPNSRFPAGGDSYLNVNAGNTGIGTTNPDEKLHVIGNIISSGNIIAEDDLILIDSEGNPRKVILHPDGTWSFKFLCDGRIKDIRDDHYYKIIQIGTHCWMAENLNIGTMINGSVNQSNNDTIEKYCYNNKPDSCVGYGGLYQWRELMVYVTDTGVRGICPYGWHVPTDTEWKILEGTVDSFYPTGNAVWDGTDFRGQDAGGNLKEAGLTHWDSPNQGATNSSGFTALAGGYSSNGGFSFIRENAYFWSSTQYDTDNAWRRNLSYSSKQSNRNEKSKMKGFSVRCVKDFTCGDSITDPRDGQNYGTVQIGDQCWMSQNMNIGARIDSTEGPGNNGIYEKFCYRDLESNCIIYGGLYEYFETVQYNDAEGTQGICPDGWHVPSDDEWKTLEGYVDSNYGIGDPVWDGVEWRGEDAGKNLKSKTGWFYDTGTDLYGFTALAGGYLHNFGYYDALTEDSFFWTSTGFGGSHSWYRMLDYSYVGSYRADGSIFYGLSVRCVKDD